VRTRLAPDARREQLLEQGVRLLATRSLEELTIDLLTAEAGVSRGLVYHYFGSKQGFHRAVVQRAADDLIAATAPPEVPDEVERLQASMRAYVDYVAAHAEGYRSILRSAAGGAEDLREIYQSARTALSERIFTSGGDLVPDTPAARLAVRGWASLAEELTLAWVEDPEAMTREELLRVLVESLPALLELTS